MTPPIRSIPLPRNFSVHINRTSSLTSLPTDDVDRAWDSLISTNPRYFNGSILSLTNITNTQLQTNVEEYKHHAIRSSVNLNLCMLSVTGVVIAHSTNTSPKVLTGIRSKNTHLYAGQREFAPCGALDVPSPSTDTFSMDDILNEILRESAEELGCSLNIDSTKTLGLVYDDHAGSADIVIRVDLKDTPKLVAGWEYDALEWIPLDALDTTDLSLGLSMPSIEIASLIRSS